MDGLETLLVMARTAFLERSPLTRQALAFADERHAGQKREIDGDIPFVTHPIEAACLLREAGHPEEVVAAGLLHDVLEDTDAEPRDLEERFGPEVTRLVAAVSDDPSIDDDARRRAALRQQVAEAGERAAVIFAADKASKTRELRVRLARARRFERADRGKIDHYEASLEMLRRQISGHPLVDQLATELDALHALRGGDRS
ncbi:MAG TPA: HD domain-containing protein [Thermoleophilaceae bacterium]